MVAPPRCSYKGTWVVLFLYTKMHPRSTITSKNAHLFTKEQKISVKDYKALIS